MKLDDLKFKDKAFLFLIGIGLTLAFFQKVFPGTKSPSNLAEAELRINEARVTVELAVSQKDRFSGLSGRKILDWDRGMLFVHEEPGRHGYVMRGMNFDLDFVFIKDDQVVDIARNVASEFSGTIQGATDYDRILEVNADWARRNGVEIGDAVETE